MTNEEIQNITLESLRDWFKKEKWVRITTSGDIAGPCGTSKNKKNPDRCLPAAKARSLTKAQRAATARKKKKAGAKGKTVVKNTKAAIVKKEGYYSNTQLEDEIRNYGYDSFEQFFGDNPGAEEAVFDFIDQNLARIQKEINEVKGLGKRGVDEFSSILADQILNFFIKHEVLKKEPYQRKYKSGLSDEDYVANTKTFYLGAIINATKKKVMADKTIIKETTNTQDGKAAPYGSGYKKVTKEDIRNLVVGTVAELHTEEKAGELKIGTVKNIEIYANDQSSFADTMFYRLVDTKSGKESEISVDVAGEEVDLNYVKEENPILAKLGFPHGDAIGNFIVRDINKELDEDTITEKDDRCTRLAKQKYDTWPSAYASGAVVRCRRGEIWKKK